MSNIRTIARPYAKAMFAAMQESDASKAASLVPLLEILSVAVKEPSMDQAIKNPSIQPDQIVDCLVSACEDINADQVKAFGKQRLQHWLGYLTQAKRLSCLPEIASLYTAELAKQQGAVDVVVSSTTPLTEAQQQALINKLSKQWNKTVHATYTTDATLLGGVRIQAGDWVLDRSIADKLLRLSEDIQS